MFHGHLYPMDMLRCLMWPPQCVVFKPITCKVQVCRCTYIHHKKIKLLFAKRKPMLWGIPVLWRVCIQKSQQNECHYSKFFYLKHNFFLLLYASPLETISYLVIFLSNHETENVCLEDFRIPFIYGHLASKIG